MGGSEGEEEVAAFNRMMEKYKDSPSEQIDVMVATILDGMSPIYQEEWEF